MGALQPAHLIIVLVIILIVFGPGKLPQLGRALGDGIRELKHASSEPDGTSSAAAAHQPAARPRVCAQCGAPVTAPSNFCGACGASIAPAPVGR